MFNTAGIHSGMSEDLRQYLLPNKIRELNYLSLLLTQNKHDFLDFLFSSNRDVMPNSEFGLKIYFSELSGSL